MKRFICMAMVVMTLAPTVALCGPGNFKKGDTWKYDYAHWYVISAGGSKATEDSIFGSVFFSLDSILSKGDTAVWYVARRDSLTHFTYYDSLYRFDTTCRQTYRIVHDSMRSTDGNASFFSFYQEPDTTFPNPPDPHAWTGWSKKTIVSNATVNNAVSRMFLQIYHSYYIDLAGMGPPVYEDDDTLLWIDNLGLYQIKSASAYYSSSSSVTYEFYTLQQHNGMSVVVLPAAVIPKAAGASSLNHGATASARYFDIEGRAIGSATIPHVHHGILIRQFPNGRYGLNAFIH